MVTVWFEGIDELNTVSAQVKTATGTVGARGSQVVRKSGFAVEAMAKQFAPVDTGFLKNSITTEFEGDGRFGAMTATVTAGANYAVYVELGTRNQAPQAFMGPALDRVAPEFVAACEALADLDLRGARGGGRVG